ncbi:MAG: helix-turn-helix domain-containing protein [Candidatus Puniceispirillales bacterium]
MKTIKDELNKSKALNKDNYTEFSEVLDSEFDNFFTQNNLSYYSNDLYNFFIKKFEKSLINKSLFLVNGNQIKASELLGINRNTLRKKIKELDIEIIKRVRN